MCLKLFLQTILKKVYNTENNTIILTNILGIIDYC